MGELVSHWTLRRLNYFPNNGYYNFALECQVHFKKLPELEQYLAGLPALPDLICIQETHLTPKHHPVFQNYTILRKDRPPSRGKGGGILICIKTSPEFSEVNLAGPSTRMEFLVVTVDGYAIFNV